MEQCSTEPQRAHSGLALKVHQGLLLARLPGASLLFFSPHSHCLGVTLLFWSGKPASLQKCHLLAKQPGPSESKT